VVVLLLTATALAIQPAVAQSAVQTCPALQLDNPNPGDTLMPGGYVVSGIAFDPWASLGSGVSHVDFYLGAREAGGLILGSAQSNPDPNSFGPPRFQVQLTIPKLTIASTDFVVYAFDASTSGETTVSVPVRVGDVTPPKGQPTPTAQVSSSCSAIATPVNLAPPLPAEIAFTPTPGPQLAGPPAAPGAPLADAPGPILQLSNPSPGDVLPVGGYVVGGIAYDPGSSSGPGIDRIQFFLDPREDGGSLLGTALPTAANPGQAPTFQATIVVPDRASRGAHVFVAYARSSVIGAEAIVSVPVFVGEKPTPTPLP
jgi:hypothetical protein